MLRHQPPLGVRAGHRMAQACSHSLPSSPWEAHVPCMYLSVPHRDGSHWFFGLEGSRAQDTVEPAPARSSIRERAPLCCIGTPRRCSPYSVGLTTTSSTQVPITTNLGEIADSTRSFSDSPPGLFPKDLNRPRFSLPPSPLVSRGNALILVRRTPSNQATGRLDLASCP